MAFNTASVTHEKRILIGAVQVNQTFRYHKANYECAAWWEDHEAVVGVHPVYLSRSYHSPRLLTITADVKGRVVNDYFPGLWGGVAISKEPYQPKHIGEERIIHVQKDVVEAIQATGNSPGSDIDWFIHPSWWIVFQEEALTELHETHKRFPEFWEAWSSLTHERFYPKMDGRWQFDDEYRSRIGMIAHFGSLLETWARKIEKINWQSQYHKPGNRYDTEYQRNLFSQNTGWAKAIPIQVNA